MRRGRHSPIRRVPVEGLNRAAVLRAPMTIDVDGPVRCAVIVDDDGSIGIALDVDLVEIVGEDEVPAWRRESTIVLGLPVARAVVELLERAVSHGSRAERREQRQ